MLADLYRERRELERDRVITRETSIAAEQGVPGTGWKCNGSTPAVCAPLPPPFNPGAVWASLVFLSACVSPQPPTLRINFRLIFARKVIIPGVEFVTELSSGPGQAVSTRRRSYSRSLLPCEWSEL